MTDNYEKKLRYKKFFLRCIPLYVLVAITCLVSSCSFGLYAEFSRDEKYMDTNNVIQADVTSLLQHSNGPHVHSNFWHVYYEYDDGNFLYVSYIIVEGKENAEEYLGKTVPIYIDGQGHSISVGEYNYRQEFGSTQRVLILGIVFLICFSIFTGLSVFLFLRKRKKIGNR